MSFESSIPPAKYPVYHGEQERYYATHFEHGISEGIMIETDYTRRIIKYLQTGMSLDAALTRAKKKTPYIHLTVGFFRGTQKHSK